MKKKQINEQVKIDGFYLQSIAKGFFGHKNEGRKLLSAMGLPSDTIPFSSAVLVQNGKATWCDSKGNRASISFALLPHLMECSGSYLGKAKSIKMLREWESHEDEDTIAKLESEAIGDLCMKCLYENLTID